MKKSPSSVTQILDVLSQSVSKTAGIQLGESQRSMVESRVRKRMIELRIAEMEDYFRFFEENRASEHQKLVSLLTTHHTFFFREFVHFTFLEEKALAPLIEAAKKRPDRTIRVWSAACSRGQEVYTLAMFLSFHLARIAPDVKFKVLGTDIDVESVATARNGVYQYSEVKQVPMLYLGDHWAKGTGDIANFVKAKKSLADHCEFEVYNLVDPQTNWKQKFDIIFCRNVFIYFTPEQIKAISGRLLSYLSPEGYLFVGITEPLNGLGLAVTNVGPAVYTNQKDEPEPAAPAPSPAAAAPAPKPAEAPRAAKRLRILCVDDSKSIQGLLKRILEPEFEVVGIANNGKEASEKVRELKPDLVTLDIHMPEQDGIAYLKENFKAGHPPVVMISSVSREEASLAIRALELGASDYVEKPTMAKFNESSEEIRHKIRCAHLSKVAAARTDLSLTSSFRSDMPIAAGKNAVRVLLLTLSDREKVAALLKAIPAGDPPTVVLIEGSAGALPEVCEGLRRASQLSGVSLLGSIEAKLSPGQVYVADFSASVDKLRSAYGSLPCSVMILGNPSANVAKKITDWNGAQILLEDLGAAGSARSHLEQIADDVLPLTSYLYTSALFFAKAP
jgi:chemotaxis protein methyltransferase CheR